MSWSSAVLADKICEVSRFDVRSVSTVNEFVDSGIFCEQFRRLMNVVNALEKKFFPWSDSKSSSRPNSRSRACSKLANISILCCYYNRFGEKAAKCSYQMNKFQNRKAKFPDRFGNGRSEEF